VQKLVEKTKNLPFLTEFCKKLPKFMAVKRKKSFTIYLFLQLCRRKVIANFTVLGKTLKPDTMKLTTRLSPCRSLECRYVECRGAKGKGLFSVLRVIFRARCCKTLYCKNYT